MESHGKYILKGIIEGNMVGTLLLLRKANWCQCPF